MQSLWEKLDWKEKLWLGAVYGISLLLTFLVAYNLGRGSPQSLATNSLPILQEKETVSARPPADQAARMSSETNAPVQEIDLSREGTSTSITVHVAGQVRKPDVYTLPSGSRIRDALQRAGGAKPEADLEGLNLAEPLHDGQKIYVPHKEETRVATAVSEPRAEGASSRSSTKSPPRFPLDINRATAKELEQLPGIGPVLAARIVGYRQMHGRFQSVDELIGVPGIGPKRLEQIRPYVVVR